MEARFGVDFGGVRVHSDGFAAASAHAVDALAYTVGQHIAFARDRYQPGTSSGRELLAHELAHTVQQRAAAHGEIDVGAPGTAVEAEARRAASSPREARLVRPIRLARPLLQRQEAVPAAGPVPPCIVDPSCEGPICGSSWDYAHKSEQETSQRAAERHEAEKRGKAKPQADVQPAKNAQSLVDRDAPDLLKGVRAMLVNPDLDPQGAEQAECGDGQCVVISAAWETQAADYLRGALHIGPKRRQRSDWRNDFLRVITHESTHARYESAPPPGIRTMDKISRFELGELNAILSEIPGKHEYLTRGLPTSTRTLSLQAQWWDHWIESCGEGIRGILHRLRCRNTCERVQNDVRAVARERMAAWPPETREAFLRVVRDPNREARVPAIRQLKWPQEPEWAP
jgi:hypothetical protein